LLFILRWHEVEGSGVISVEITWVKNLNMNGRNVVLSQAGGTCHALEGVGGGVMRDKAIAELVRQRVFLKALLVTEAEMAKFGGLWWEEGGCF
jgi:hypothetical protein